MRSASTISDHVFLIASSSVASWWRSMAGELKNCKAVLLDENSAAGVTELAEQLSAVAERNSNLVFLSSHASLQRDFQIAELLKQRGFERIFGTCGAGAQLGFDKVVMKRAFDRFGIPTPRWWVAGVSVPFLPVLVCKSRFGTMGEGHRIAGRFDSPDAAVDYVEEFVSGVEYSVIIVRRNGRSLCFPPVWKGRTNEQLIPPHRRARFCSSLHSVGATPARMLAISKAIAEAMDFDGFLEVEFVVSPSRGPLVLEINPRVAGTMRMASLSADVPLFDLSLRLERDLELPPLALSMELPLDRPLPSHLAIDGVSATSRVTISAPTAELLSDRLHTVVAADPAIPERALAIAYQELEALLKPNLRDATSGDSLKNAGGRLSELTIVSNSR